MQVIHCTSHFIFIPLSFHNKIHSQSTSMSTKPQQATKQKSSEVMVRMMPFFLALHTGANTLAYYTRRGLVTSRCILQPVLQVKVKWTWYGLCQIRKQLLWILLHFYSNLSASTVIFTDILQQGAELNRTWYQTIPLMCNNIIKAQMFLELSTVSHGLLQRIEITWPITESLLYKLGMERLEGYLAGRFTQKCCQKC